MKEQFVRLLSLGSLTLLLLVVPLMAEEGRDLNFYRKDYAKSPLESKESGFTEFDSKGKASDKAGSSGSEAADTNHTPTPIPTPAHLGAPRKILALSLILNITDQEHANMMFQKLSELLKYSGIKLSMLYLIGDKPWLVRESQLIKGLDAKGYLIKSYPTAPPGFPISKSPTWVLHAAEGEILLEAMPNPIGYFDSNANFYPGDLDPNEAKTTLKDVRDKRKQEFLEKKERKQRQTPH